MFREFIDSWLDEKMRWRDLLSFLLGTATFVAAIALLLSGGATLLRRYFH